MQNWTVALGVCVAAVLLEMVCAGRDPAAALKSLQQPRWALPFAAWVAVGLAYYAMCFFALSRLLPVAEAAATCIALLVVVMTADAIWNYFFFRRRDFWLAFACLVPYAALALAFLACVAPHDRGVAIVAGLYFLYLPYAFAWTYQVWKPNQKPQ